MLERFYPSEYADSVFRIDFERLRKLGFCGLIIDVDNTLVHHGDPPTPKVSALLEQLRAMGFKTVLLSDNDESRMREFTRNLNTDYIANAGKPDPEGFEKALTKLNTPKSQTIVIGDQIFTDICGANAAGIPSILVHYITVPGQRIGKKRRIEKAILFAWRRSRHRAESRIANSTSRLF